jgi:hypothetical protein
VNLWGAQAFSIEVTNARLACGAGPALRGDGIALGQHLLMRNLMISDGGISLIGATIGGQLWLNNAELHNTTGWAMNAPTITVGACLVGATMYVSMSFGARTARMTSSSSLSSWLSSSRRGARHRAGHKP